MNLQTLVSVDRLRLDVPVRSKKHAIQTAAGILANDLEDISANRLFDALIARERLGCTALGRGIALPHAAVDGLDKSRGCVIKFTDPIEFDDDTAPVSLIFALIVPARAQGAENDDLQRTCDFLSHGEHRRSLLGAATIGELFDALGEKGAPPLREATGR